MNTEQIAKMIEQAEPRAKCAVLPDQVIVRYTNRPEVEIAALTPYYQTRLRQGKLKIEDITPLFFEIIKIANAV